MSRQLMPRADPLARKVYNGIVNWFPGHMAKATRQIEQRLRDVDFVIEMRDARIPFSSANPTLNSLLGQKPRLVVFNKSDLANPNMQARVRDKIAAEGADTLFTVASKGINVKDVVKWALTVNKQQAANGSDAESQVGKRFMMIVGVPNIGKSSIINAMRHMSHSSTGTDSNKRGDQFTERLSRPQGGKGKAQRKRAKVGSQPGVTRHLNQVQVHTNPPIFLLDTPGVMVPHIGSAEEDVECGLKLALTGAVREGAVPADVLVDYLMLQLHRSHRLKGSRKGKGGKMKLPQFLEALKLGDIYAERGAGKGSLEGARTGAGERAVPGGAAGDAEDGLSELRGAIQSEPNIEPLTLLDLLAHPKLISASGAAGKPPQEMERRVAAFVLKQYRSGALGRYTLDSLE
jgi:ribosome biogenesis GTPase A